MVEFTHSSIWLPVGAKVLFLISHPLLKLRLFQHSFKRPLLLHDLMYFLYSSSPRIGFQVYEQIHYTKFA